MIRPEVQLPPIYIWADGVVPKSINIYVLLVVPCCFLLIPCCFHVVVVVVSGWFLAVFFMLFIVGFPTVSCCDYCSLLADLRADLITESCCFLLFCCFIVALN